MVFWVLRLADKPAPGARLQSREPWIRRRSLLRGMPARQAARERCLRATLRAAAGVL